jgi:pyruvate/2-oxoacid:ferredoxin oxidoreductase alpha subunit
VPNTELLTGNSAASVGVKLCKPKVVAAYPITPQSAVAETLSQYVDKGELEAEYVNVEGEHSALTVCISASFVGARVFTATSANGLAYMHEQLHWAAGSRLPIVMCCVNRGVGAPWTIFNDQQDSLSQRDTGWIQIYCRDNQEIIDTVIQAYRIAEQVCIPVMVCYDGFILSHTMMPVDVPEGRQVDAFLPPYSPEFVLSSDDPKTVNPVLLPQQRADNEGVLREGYMDMRYKLHAAMDDARAVVEKTNTEFAELFGRDHGGMLWEYRTEDADMILTGMGSVAVEATVAADLLREEGVKAGVVGIRVFRPFPAAEAVNVFKRAKAIAVFQKGLSYGYQGSLTSDLKAAFYGTRINAPVHDHIVGLGGRDVKPRELVEAAKQALGPTRNPAETKWLNTDTRNNHA